MIRIIESQLCQALRLINIYPAWNIIIGINIFIFPQCIKIKCTSHRIDFRTRSCHPFSGSNGMFKIPLVIVEIIMSPSRTLGTINNIFPVVQEHNIRHFIIHERFVYFMNQHVHLSRCEIGYTNLLFVKSPGFPFKINLITIFRGVKYIHVLVLPTIDIDRFHLFRFHVNNR